MFIACMHLIHARSQAAAPALDAFASPVNYCRSWLNLEPLLSLKVSTGDKSRCLITLGAVARERFKTGEWLISKASKNRCGRVLKFGN
jgi:hypothetical protein